MESDKEQASAARACEAETDAVPLDGPLGPLWTRVRALAVSRAAAAFQGFSLSKYRDQPPPSYVCAPPAATEPPYIEQ